MLISFSIVVALAIARGSAQTTTAAPAPTSSAVPPAAQPANGSALEARVARLEERLSSTLAVIDQRIQIVNDRSEISTRILYGFSLLGGFILIFFSIRDWLSRSTETK